MLSCLGIYMSDEIIKFAKMSYEKNTVKLEQCGTRFVKFDPISQITSIIQETNSSAIPIAISPEVSEFINIEMYNQINPNKSYVSDIAKVEFEAWCEKNAKSIQKYDYIFKSADTNNINGKKSLILNVVDKDVVNKYTSKLPSIKSVYPSTLLTNRLVPKEEQNYVLVDLSDNLTITVVVNNKVQDIHTFRIGMNQILKDFSTVLGSYHKAYDACKQINVFSEGENENNRELEALLEPLLQEVLKNVEGYVEKYRRDIDKVILTGDGIIFTNIDILFTEFLDQKCEILKPEFLGDTSNVRNTADMLETIEAMALAYDVLVPKPKQSEYFKNKENKKSLMGGKHKALFAKKEKQPKEQKSNPNIIQAKSINQDLLNDILICASIVAGFILVAYIVFSTLYVSKLNNMQKNVEETIAKVSEKTTEVKSDYEYIEKNTKEYKTINDQVSDIVGQIEENKIGKFTTYNVATFLQNIIKIIPKNVKLVNISSDDNKNVVITASSKSYADLGYFVAELKINNTLKSINVKNVKNSEETVVEIGGELP